MFYYELCFEKSCVRHNSIILTHEFDHTNELNDFIQEACNNIKVDASLPDRTFKIAKYLIENKGFKRFSTDAYVNVDYIIEQVEEDA